MGKKKNKMNIYAHRRQESNYYPEKKKKELEEKEIKEKYLELKEEMREVLKWKYRTKKDKLIEVRRRIETLRGEMIYWKLRMQGKSHLISSIAQYEFWEKCKNLRTKK